MEYIKLPATQNNIPKDQYPLHRFQTVVNIPLLVCQTLFTGMQT